MDDARGEQGTFGFLANTALAALPIGMVPEHWDMSLTPFERGMKKLQRLESIEVRERASAIQEVSAFLGWEIEMANRYGVLDSRGHHCFYAVETTNAAARQMQVGCCHECAPWDVNILHTTLPGGFHPEHFVSLSRPLAFSCCCCWRTKATMRNTITQEDLGYIVDPHPCCTFLSPIEFKLRDGSDTDVLRIRGDCCQLGLLCPLPLGPCRHVNFDVLDAASGETVGHVQKEVPSWLSFVAAPDVDNYKVKFDGVERPEFKALLVAFAIFLDFRYFNNNVHNEQARRQSGSWASCCCCCC